MNNKELNFLIDKTKLDLQERTLRFDDYTIIHCEIHQTFEELRQKLLSHKKEITSQSQQPEVKSLQGDVKNTVLDTEEDSVGRVSLDTSADISSYQENTPTNGEDFE